MVAAIQDRFKVVDARNWPKRRSNDNAEAWEKVNTDIKGIQNYESWE